MPANADSSVAAVRDTQGLPLYSDNETDHAVNCVVPHCVNNTDGSLNFQKSYDAALQERGRKSQ